MGKLKTNQNGFSIIEGLLILVIVGLIGFVGWYVWHAKSSTDKALTVNNSSTPSFKKKTPTKVSAQSTGSVFATLPSGWTEYKSDNNGLRLGYPQEWGTLSGNPLSTTDYRNDSKNIQGRLVINMSAKQDFSTVASKYGATIKPSADGKSWVVSEENPATADGYKVGDTYKTKAVAINGGTAVDLTQVDEDCTMARWLIPLKNAYAVVSVPELCPVNLQISDTNKTSYSQLTADFIKTLTVY